MKSTNKNWCECNEDGRYELSRELEILQLLTTFTKCTPESSRPFIQKPGHVYLKVIHNQVNIELEQWFKDILGASSNRPTNYFSTTNCKT